VFTTANLKNYRAVIFCNSNNEAFAEPAQSTALTGYVETGGGFAGIHSASGSERANPDFKRILGGTFKWHTPNQKFTVLVADKNHPATSGLPAAWAWKDEGYLCDLVPDLHVLLDMDTTSVVNPPREKWALKFDGNRFPLAWCQQVGKGRCFYTALGHDKEAYADPAFRKHIQGGILWVLDMAK
jgi:type 1 glutamine amidotransferase